jgi:hypothetical protein
MPDGSIWSDTKFDANSTSDEYTDCSRCRARREEMQQYRMFLLVLLFRHNAMENYQTAQLFSNGIGFNPATRDYYALSDRRSGQRLTDFQ